MKSRRAEEQKRRLGGVQEHQGEDIALSGVGSVPGVPTTKGQVSRSGQEQLPCVTIMKRVWCIENSFTPTVRPVEMSPCLQCF